MIFRIIIHDNFKIKTGIYLNNISFVNFLACLFLGILVALDPINRSLLLLFYFGFLGCLSTFSSFIYRLFNLLQRKQFALFFMHYIEVIVLSFLFFNLGYFLVKIF